jgi:hypothetical protein
MDSFQKTVLFGAIIILLIALVIIGIALKYGKNNYAWPPLTPPCPDYWTINGEGDKATCTNVKNLGKCKPPSGTKHLTMNFNQAPYIGTNSLCAKYNWANNCDVTWDGVNYGIAGNPCNPEALSSTGTCNK